MATESLRGRSDEATLTSEPEPAIKTTGDSQNVNPEQPHVNGDVAASATEDIENKHISEIVDDLVNSTEVSVSGGSDNEASKGDGSKLKDGEKGHGRTSSSVKKPTSFKSISVNKTFLTTKGSATTAPVKPSDKLAPTSGTASTPSATLAASRPRLVAKSGSGLVAKSSSGANGGKSGSAPDPNAVWNKNRPVPPPPPKNYTDEELKKYGIHMASRLQTDDSKAGQANWADIDEDDDDWAPDTITWQDGTKIAIPHTEELAPAPEPARAPSPAPAPAPAPALAAPRLATKENGVVEKPKPAPAAPSIIKPGVLASGKGLVLKGAPEKPTLVAKPPAPPTPVKSPWAAIPRVDKASPVVAELPNQGLAKYPTKDAPIAKTITPPPPKEIAADDFSRSAWRDASSGAGRELYNSQSGRYEPVTDRRGSLRPEHQHGRQPALLQRSSHDQQGPIDPATFQGRPGEAPYGRRRGSSNVSGGSGAMHRLGLKTHDQPLPPAELINRRGSMTGRSDSPASPRTYSPGPRHGQAWPTTRASPAMSHATPHQQHAQPVPPAAQQQIPAVTEDELELQKRVMRERRELAMKRRLEEEAREEAERKERIRLKLAALGPAPESNSAKKAAAKDHPAVTPTQIQAREALPEHPPTASEETKPSDKALSTSTPSEAGKSEPANGVLPQFLPSPDSVESRSQPHGGSHAHGWPHPPKQPERYPAVSWGAQPTTAKNVWGAPNNNRSLGNGTFNADLVTAPVQLSTQTGPGPIAPPTSSRAPQASAGPEPTARLPPIGPPKQAPSGRLDAHDRAAKQNTWAASVRLADAAFNQMLNDDFDKREQQLRKEGRTVQDLQPVIKDTWRPTKLDELGYRNDSAPKQSIQLGQDASWAGPPESKPAVPQKEPAADSQRAQVSMPGRDAATASILGSGNAAPQPSRGSRFFPTHRDRHDAGSEAAQRPKSPSPPPPDMAGHPVFDGDVAHPHVSLPRPAVVVRLPPPSIPTEPRGASVKIPQGPASMTHGPSFAWASQAAYKEETSPVTAAPGPSPSTAPGGWQQKFDSLLFGGRRSHPAPRSPVAEFPGHHISGHIPSAILSGQDGSVTTKVRDEECFEEQEMGSLPPVRLPNEVPENAWLPSEPPRPLSKKFWAHVSSAEAITFPPDVSGSGTVWRVALPIENFKPVVITLPFGRTRSNPRRGGGQRGGRHPPTAPHQRGGKGRDGSSTYSNDQGSGPSSSNSTPNRNNRGGFRGGRGEGWNRPSQAIRT
ncbi:hypothetical protein B0T16DRAFT_330530 [Cercophora newfieldiana]|uniref:Uncharacterized protein n=1 Tax=Cercophora newfieldiana TaxID=92897 RepID=A0AA39Y3Y6_9PEZI|nr:hypothetical protein B0T16DRAFT_330530 [Cercophora newfieldiana]